MGYAIRRAAPRRLTGKRRSPNFSCEEGAMGWQVRVSPELAETPPPSEEELRLIREVLDPAGNYTG